MLQSVGVKEIAGHPETGHVAVNGALRSIYGWAVSAFFVGVGGGGHALQFSAAYKRH